MPEKLAPLATERATEIQKWVRIHPRRVKTLRGGKVWRRDVSRYGSNELSAADFDALKEDLPRLFDEGAGIGALREGPPMKDSSTRSNAVPEYTEIRGSEPPESAPEPAPRALLVDDSAEPLDRADALFSCALEDPNWAASFALREVSRDDLAPEWRDALLLTLEDMRFIDRDLRRRLAARLLQLGRTMRRTAEPGIETVMCSALRTYASLIPPSEAGTLLEFLDPPTPVDSRLTALQGVANVFGPSPPGDVDALAALADRIAQLGEKFLDPDAFIPGERAAIALNAVHALATIGDARVDALISQAKRLGRPWFLRQLAHKLTETLGSWENSPASSSPAVTAMNKILAAVQ